MLKISYGLKEFRKETTLVGEVCERSISMLVCRPPLTFPLGSPFQILDFGGLRFRANTET